MNPCALRTNYSGLALSFLYKTEAPRRGTVFFALVLFFMATFTEPWWYGGDWLVCGGRKIKQRGRAQAEGLAGNRHQNLLRKKESRLWWEEPQDGTWAPSQRLWASHSTLGRGEGPGSPCGGCQLVKLHL